MVTMTEDKETVNDSVEKALNSDTPLERIWQSLASGAQLEKGNLEAARHLFFAGATATLQLMKAIDTTDDIDKNEAMDKIFNEIDLHHTFIKMEVERQKAKG